MSFDADVIVVGGGPAGSLSAFFMAQNGIHVTLLEKSDFPRYKVCGGGLTHKILKEIPFDLSPVIETTIHDFRFSHRFEDIFTRHSDEPLMYCSMRTSLDDFLLQKAKETGVTVLTGEQVVAFAGDDSGVTVTTRKNTYRTRLLVGAEGASGIVSRTAGLRSSIEMGIAWEAEIHAHAEDLARYSTTVFLDWGTLPGGYAWIFPKKDHFSIGVGGPASLSQSMMNYYDRFLASVGPGSKGTAGEGIRFLDTYSKASWPIPVRTRKSMFHKGRVLIAGDAAGLGDPLTGEGIYYAVRSGKLAASTCLEYLSGETRNLERYTERVNEELMTELAEANRIKHIFNAVPGKIHDFVGSSDRAWRAFGKILRGERWYADVRIGFGKWKHLWKPAVFLASLISKKKEKRYSRMTS